MPFRMMYRWRPISPSTQMISLGGRKLVLSETISFVTMLSSMPSNSFIRFKSCTVSWLAKFVTSARSRGVSSSNSSVSLKIGPTHQSHGCDVFKQTSIQCLCKKTKSIKWKSNKLVEHSSVLPLEVMELQQAFLQADGEISGSHVLHELVLMCFEPHICIVPICNLLHQLCDAVCVAPSAEYLHDAELIIYHIGDGTIGCRETLFRMCAAP